MSDEESGAGSTCRDKCCGSWWRKLLSTLGILVVILALLLIILYTTMTGVSPIDEKHTLATQGTCANTTSDDSSIKVMSFNTFMIRCVGGKCQEADLREERARTIGEWFKDRDEDVVLMQELWSNHDVIRDEMAEAGFCHFVMTEKNFGSGMAIFSKHPIDEQHFEDFAGNGYTPSLSPENFIAAKGVLYAKVVKSGQPIHVFNMHMTSDTYGDLHSTRLKQYKVVKDLVDSKNITAEELVLLGGDMNEDKECREFNCEFPPVCENRAYYEAMLSTMSAGGMEIITEDAWTYNTVDNQLLRSLYDAECNYLLLLDHILYSEDHLQVSDSSTCEIIKPLDAEGMDISDHFPVTCDIEF